MSKDADAPASFVVPEEIGDEEDFSFLEGVVSHVRFHGLQGRTELNGIPGVNVGLDVQTGRWAILPWGRKPAVKVKRDNLERYVPQASDACPVCSEILNLSAVPACACREEKPSK